VDPFEIGYVRTGARQTSLASRSIQCGRRVAYCGDQAMDRVPCACIFSFVSYCASR
jgi:hypothetical protein